MTKLARTIIAVVALGAGTAVCTATEAHAAGPANSRPAASASPSRITLINGPIVNGPLIDLGGVLNNLQIGQFQ